MSNRDTRLNVRVTRAIKAELARRDLDGADLIAVLELSRNTIYARLRYEQPFDLDEVEKVATFLGMKVDDLLESAKLSPTEIPAAVASSARSRRSPRSAPRSRRSTSPHSRCAISCPG
mgnify:CR=1 FL=1